MIIPPLPQRINPTLNAIYGPTRHIHSMRQIPGSRLCLLAITGAGRPLVVVGRHAVYSAAVPAALYDELAQTNSPFAKALKSAQRKAIEDLWQRVQARIRTLQGEAYLGDVQANGLHRSSVVGVTPLLPPPHGISSRASICTIALH